MQRPCAPIGFWNFGWYKQSACNQKLLCERDDAGAVQTLPPLPDAKLSEEAYECLSSVKPALDGVLGCRPFQTWRDVLHALMVSAKVFRTGFSISGFLTWGVRNM